MMKIQRKIVITCLVVLMAVAAFSGVGYAYTAMTVNSGNTSTSEYTVISQSTYTYSPSGSMDYYSAGASGAYTVKVGTGAMSGTLKKAEDCFMSLNEAIAQQNRISTVVITGGAYDGTYTIDMTGVQLADIVTTPGVVQKGSKETVAAIDSGGIRYSFESSGVKVIKLKVTGTADTAYTISMPSGITVTGFDASTDIAEANRSFTSNSVTITCPDDNAHMLGISVIVSAAKEYPVTYPKGMTFSLNSVVQNAGVTAAMDLNNIKYTYGSASDHDMRMKVMGAAGTSYTIYMPNGCTIRGISNATDAKIRDISVTSGSVTFTCPDANQHILALTVDVSDAGDYIVAHPTGLTFGLNDVEQNDLGPLDFTAINLSYDGVRFDNIAIGNDITVVYDELAKKYTITGELKYQANSGGDAMDKLGMPDNDHYGVSFLVSYSKAALRYFVIDSGAPYSIKLFNGYYGKKIGTELNDITVIDGGVKVKCPDNNAHVLSMTVRVDVVGTYMINHPAGMTFSLDGVTQNDTGVTGAAIDNSGNVSYTFSSTGDHVVKVKVSGTSGTEYTIAKPTGCTIIGACDGKVNTLTINNVGTERTNKVTVSSDNGFAKLYGGWRYILKVTDNDDHAVQYAMSDGGDWIYYHYVDGKWLQEKYLEMSMNTNGYDTELFIAGPSAHIEYDYASGTAELKYTGELSGRESNDLVKNGTITFRYDSTYE